MKSPCVSDLFSVFGPPSPVFGCPTSKSWCGENHTTPYFFCSRSPVPGLRLSYEQILVR